MAFHRSRATSPERSSSSTTASAFIRKEPRNDRSLLLDHTQRAQDHHVPGRTGAALPHRAGGR
nr:hypothetical protein [Betaproteobacteria bacterium]